MFRPLIALTVSLALLAAPALAGEPTSDRLAGAKEQLAAVRNELDQATADLQAAYDRYQGTQNEIAETRASIARVSKRIAGIRATLAERARAAYVAGPGGALQILLSSASFSDLSDGVEYLGAVQQSSSDLVLLAESNRERLRRSRDRLAALAEEQAATVEEMEAREKDIESKLGEISDLVAQLTEKLEKEREAARRRAELIGQNPDPLPQGPPGAGLQVCPVAGPNSFVDSWGAPRSGGRTHEGTDIIAAFGTPVVAAQTGTVRFSSDPLGGLSAYVNATNGDETYYAHLSSYGPHEGAVQAGELIGHVGSTGNAGDVNHLHFSYRPGGVPTNPYPYLLKVC